VDKAARFLEKRLSKVEILPKRAKKLGAKVFMALP
jgi:hypothetical protein